MLWIGTNIDHEEIFPRKANYVLLFSGGEIKTSKLIKLKNLKKYQIAYFDIKGEASTLLPPSPPTPAMVTQVLDVVDAIYFPLSFHYNVCPNHVLFNIWHGKFKLNYENYDIAC